MNNKRTKDFISLYKLNSKFFDLNSIHDKWGYIRQAYMELIPDIIKASKKGYSIGIDPYFLPWIEHMSYLEKYAWGEIRGIGNIPLYPQFPVFNFFIDFANPYLRIGLELDSKEYHDKKRDLDKDEFLAEFGWKIFRIQSHECHENFKDLNILDSEMIQDHETRDKEIRNWLTNSLSGVIQSIKIVYFKDEIHSDLLEIAKESLNQHKLANFEL